MYKEGISIITPLYNCEKYIKELYDCVINQTFSNWEWIIVDDCSTDGSYSKILEINNDSRIHIYKTNTNSGSAAARNIGLKNAQMRYITFLDADDLLDNNYLDSQYAFIQENGPIITAGYRRLARKTCTSFMPKDNITYKQLLNGCDTSCLTTMFDRQIINDIYFCEHLMKDEDYIFWLNILKKGYSVKTNKTILATYRISKHSKNGNKIKLLKPIYNIYHNELKMNMFQTIYHIAIYFCYGLKKYYNVK